MSSDHITEALQHAASALAAFKPSRVAGEPDRVDALNRIDDMLAVADIVDKIWRAFGEQSRFDLGVSETDVDELFSDVTRNAIEGNATFAIDEAVSAELIRHRPLRRLTRGF